MSEKNNGPAVLDLDAVRPEKRIVKLAGKEIDVTVIPFECMLDIVDKLDTFQALEKNGADGPAVKGALEFLYKTTVRICQVADKKITEDWLREHADVVQMVQLMSFVVAPLMERISDSKNLLAVGLGEKGL
jgi:hypothetical protein